MFFKLAALACVVVPLTGCVAAIPLATGAAVTGASVLGTNAVVDGAVDQKLRAEQMNCRELQAEFKRLDSFGSRLNPTNSVKKANVIDIARAKGCRIQI